MALVSKDKFLKKTEKLPKQKAEAGSGLMSRDDFVSFAQAAQKERQEQQRKRYEETYQQYKQIANSINHDQLSGYLRTMQERQNQIIDSINGDECRAGL